MAELTKKEKIAEYIKCLKDPVYFVNNYAFVFNINTQKISKIQCFPYQEEFIKNLHENKNNIVLKSRQCLPENTFVDTPNGPKAIQDCEIGDSIYSYNLRTNETEIDTVVDAWCSGDVGSVKLKLKDTRNVEVGENHPFWIVNKNQWVKAKDLEIDDEILDANIGFGSVEANEEEIKMLSYLITDGCTNKQVKFTNNNIDYLEEFEECVYSTFPDLEIRKSAKNNGFDYYPHQKHGVNTKSSIMEWCESKGIANKKTELKNLPKEVFEWNKKSVSLLINRIFAGDGWISILKKGSNKRMEIGLGSPSIIFLEQVKFLLKNFGIKCNIYEVKNMKLQQNTFYKLRVTHSKSISKFINEIGIYKKVKQEHFEISNNVKHDVKDVSKVRKIEHTGIKRCFDISVKNNENFLINGLLVHNTGLSVITSCYIAWRLIFRVDERILVVADNGAGAVRFLGHIRNVLDNLPSFLLPEARPSDNTKQIVFSNGSWVKAVASSKQAGRGETLTMLVLDEAAFIEHAEDIWAGAGVALSASGGKCVMISTPYGAKGLYHQTWVAAEKGEALGEREKDEIFHTTKIHWSDHPLFSKEMHKIIDEKGKEKLTSPWYEAQCEKLHHNVTKIAQELDLSFEASGANVIDPDILDVYEKNLIGKTVECYYNYKLDNVEARFTNAPNKFRVWEKYIQGANYIVSADVARGDGSDYSTIQVINADTLNQAAEYQDRLPPDEFGKLLYSIGKDYGNAYLAVECNSFGLATTLTLKNQLGYKANRMYHSKSAVQMFDRYTPYKYNVDKGSDIPGFQTTTTTRPLVINALIKYMNSKEVKINSPRIMEEFKTFVYNNGKAEHSQGAHDDLIFALGIGLLIRDTEIEGVFRSNNMTKALLNNISVSSKQYQNPGASGDLKKPFEDDEDLNDTSWLFGPIKG